MQTDLSLQLSSLSKPSSTIQTDLQDMGFLWAVVLKEIWVTFAPVLTFAHRRLWRDYTRPNLLSAEKWPLMSVQTISILCAYLPIPADIIQFVHTCISAAAELIADGAVAPPIAGLQKNNTHLFTASISLSVPFILWFLYLFPSSIDCFVFFTPSLIPILIHSYVLFFVHSLVSFSAPLFPLFMYWFI